MNLFQRNIEYFMKCAVAGSFQEVARSLGITQASLSLAIKKLESEISTQLFERNQKGIKITQKGKELYERLVTSGRDLERSLSKIIGNTNSLTLKFGAPSPFFEQVLLPALEPIRNSLPRFVCFYAPSVELYSAVEQGKIDFACVNWDHFPTGKLTATRLRTMTPVVVGLKSKFGHLKKAKSIEELKKEPWITSYRQPEYAWTSLLEGGAGGFVVANVSIAKLLVLNGQGIGISEIEYFSTAELKRLVVLRSSHLLPHAHLYRDASTYFVHPSLSEETVRSARDAVLRSIKNFM